ncbi:MAG: saccharopine dehydrogenase C-terminal domain-containing protein [Lutibacter sp.]|uniref:saccharopine dehydrogenase family protein n=1 Tax=Lutibacter sp. TaxID=1925666 RepID=UPI00299E6D34|nr:saccharopine dehydrogenase C-terminal domain-containing protein [Lutibacter sp.]MDX1829679.1 saccharopine dehydrogenase C-terminal domain-containing protein [Lutibacter sp.]
MSNIIVLGAGMVGSTMAIDLTKKHNITLADFSQKALEIAVNKCNKLQTLQIDVTNKIELEIKLQPFDLVICAVPGFLGFQTLKNILEAKKNVVDISFFPENSLELDELAKKNNVTAIVDCGVAPGMGNIILGHYNEKLKITDFECLVGGLPKVKKWPFNYKAPFSPVDVIEEYTRPARYVENGNVIIKDALSDVELVDFKSVGTLESFNSDGLRSLIFTMSHIKNMKEKTLRYPGHVEYVQVLKQSGFFDTNPIKINGNKISPLEFTSKILFNEWKLGETEEELTVMKISLKGIDINNNSKTIVYHLHDEFCPKTKTSSMARTTGYTATAAANMFLDGLFKEKGVFPPELIGSKKGVFEYILNYLKERNVKYIKEEF